MATKFDTAALDDVDRFDTSLLDVEIAKDEEAEKTTNRFVNAVKRFGLRAFEGSLESLGIVGDLQNVLIDHLKNREPSLTDFFPTNLAVLTLAKGAALVPFPGSEAIKSGVESVSPLDFTARDNRVSGRIADTVSREIGAAAIPALGVLRIARNAERAPNAIKGLLEFARENPAKFLGGEATVAAGAGISRGITQEFTDDPVALLIAELGGSLVTGQLVDVAATSSKAVRLSRGKDKSAEILQEQATDAEQALRKLEADDSVGDLTSAQASEDFGLLSQERAQIRTPEGGAEFRNMKNRTNEAARAELMSIGQGNRDAPRQLIEDRVRRIDEAIDKKIVDAKAEVTEQINTFPKDTNTGEISKLAATELDNALASARQLEKASWNNVNFNIQADTTPLANLAQELEGVTTKAKKGLGTKVPDDIKAQLGLIKPRKGSGIEPFTEFESVQEIQDFRSILLDRVRQEAGGDRPNRQLLSIYDSLQEKSMEILQGSEDIAAAFSSEDLLLYRQALNTTRKLNQTFYTGDIGQLMKYDTKGARKVDDAVILDRLFKPGAKGASNARALVDAVGGEQITKISEDFLDRQFTHQVQNLDGTLNIPAAERFIKNNNELLDEFPELKKRFLRVTDTAKSSDRAIKLGAARQKALHERSKARLFLNTDAEKVIPRIRAERDPLEATRNVIKMLAKDESGEALNGFKRLFIDDLIRSSESRAAGALDSPLLRESAVRTYLRDNRRLMTSSTDIGGKQVRLFSQDEMSRLDTVANTLRKLELSNQKVAAGSDTVQNLNALTSLLARVSGAKIGAAIGGTIQSASLGMSLFKNIATKLSTDEATKLVEEAIFNKELMQSLLMRPSVKNTPVIVNRLRGHLSNIGVDIDSLLTEEQGVSNGS